MKEAQFKKNRKLKANTVNKKEKVEPPTRRFAFRQDPQDKSKLKRYSIHNLPKAAEPQPTVNEKEMAKCKICGVSVPKHMAKHLRKVHGKPTLVRLSKKQLKSVNTWLNSTRRIPDTEEKVVLISRRGTRVKDGQCAECGKRVQPCWKYAISNRGPVFLCGPCKPEVFERSFGFSETVDALDIASRGGGFETNRRRH
jgi:hypothetical protein